MHIWTRLKRESDGKTGLGTYPDGMVEHDGQVGQTQRPLPHNCDQYLVLARREGSAGAGLAEAPTQTPHGPSCAGGELRRVLLEWHAPIVPTTCLPASM